MSLDQLHSLPPAQQQAILNGPALAPPAGVVPNLGNPPNGNVLCLIITTFLLLVATSAFTLAGYVKLFYDKRIYLEDFFAFVGFQFGLFVHQWNVRVKDLAGIFYLFHIASEPHGVCIVLFKTAILLEWVRIFVPRATRDIFFWTCHILLWSNVVFYTIILISANLSCKLYAKLWDKTLPGNCSGNDVIDIATASYNFVSNTLILLLPQRMIWRLHLNTRKKIGIAFIFAIGIRYISPITTFTIALFAEAVCDMLVFYVPILPKAFKDARNPFRLLAPVFSRPRNSTGASSANSHSNFGGHVESGLSHPHRTYTPQMSILRTTQISITRGCDYESTPQNLQDARRY
ncbi:hypothetical protein F4801DRAFT_590474 [Xylaria longipes]|nr:hypothetical protein F4801DRAFT_590474 [Xylaria longipes]